MRNPIAADGEEGCDWCDVTQRLCPGIVAHCAAGKHCVDVIEVCGLEASHDDHPRTCEHCGEALHA